MVTTIVISVGPLAAIPKLREQRVHLRHRLVPQALRVTELRQRLLDANRLRRKGNAGRCDGGAPAAAGVMTTDCAAQAPGYFLRKPTGILESVFRYGRNPEMPIRNTLVRVCRVEYGGFSKVAADQLKGCRQARLGEATGY